MNPGLKMAGHISLTASAGGLRHMRKPPKSMLR